MAQIIATYSPCCGIFRVGDAEQGVMHCALPHERKVIRLVDENDYQEAVLNKEKRIKELEYRLANMVRWLDEHQPDVWKRGLWEALEPI